MQFNCHSSRAYQRINDEFDPFLHCAVFGISLGGGKEKSKFSESTKQNTEKTQEASTATTGKKASTSTESGTKSQTASSTAKGDKSGTLQADDVSSQQALTRENIRTLDAETQEVLAQLVADAGGDLSELVGSLSSSALTAEADLSGLIDPIVANARTNLQEQVGTSKQALARAAGGSSQNTLVQQLGLREGARAEAEIADLAARLGIQTQQAASQQKGAAVDAAGGVVANLANILKGAEQTSTGESSTDAVRALSQITGESSTESTISNEFAKVFSESAVSELSSSLSESTMKELASLIGETKGRGKTSGGSFGLSLGD